MLYNCYGKVNNAKGKVHYTPLESVGGCSSASPRPWAHRWRATNVCDAWLVWRQTYGYLPSRKASPPIGWYQIILLAWWQRHICANNLPRAAHSTAGWPGFEPATCWSQIQHPNHSTIGPHKEIANNNSKIMKHNFVKFIVLLWQSVLTVICHQHHHYRPLLRFLVFV